MGGAVGRRHSLANPPTRNPQCRHRVRSRSGRRYGFARCGTEMDGRRPKCLDRAPAGQARFQRSGAGETRMTVMPFPAPEPVNLSPEFSEDALALEFSARHGCELRYVHQWGAWLQWDGTRWKFEKTLRTRSIWLAWSPAISPTLVTRMARRSPALEQSQLSKSWPAPIGGMPPRSIFRILIPGC